MKNFFKPHIYRTEGCWAATFCGRGVIWRNTQDFKIVCEGLQVWLRNIYTRSSKISVNL